MSALTFTLIQTNIIWENKQANLELLTKKIESIKEKTQVVILPEMFSTGFSMQPHLFAETTDEASVIWMKETAAKHKIILCGS